MGQRRTKEERKQILSEYLADRSQLRQILKKHKVAKSTFYGWLRKYCKKCDQPVYTDFTAKNHLDLMNRLTKTEQMVEVLREVHCNCHSPLREKLEELEFLHGKYSVHVLCEALNVPRGTFYNHILRGKHGNTVQAQRREELKEAIKRVYDLGNRCFGVRKVTAILQKEGHHVSKDMVHKLMREMELFSFRTDAKREYEREMRRKRDHVEREFNPDSPNVIWVSDVTEIRHKNRKLYLCAVLDLFARRIVGYHVGYNNSTHLIKMAFSKAWKDRGPIVGLTFHSDRGSNYQSTAMVTMLKGLNVTISYSRPRTPYDNSVMEAFFKSFKAELIYRGRFTSEAQLRREIEKYMTFYNTVRPHAANNYKTPAEKEETYTKK